MDKYQNIILLVRLANTERLFTIKNIPLIFILIMACKVFAAPLISSPEIEMKGFYRAEYDAMRLNIKIFSESISDTIDEVQFRKSVRGNDSQRDVMRLMVIALDVSEAQSAAKQFESNKMRTITKLDSLMEEVHPDKCFLENGKFNGSRSSCVRAANVFLAEKGFGISGDTLIIRFLDEEINYVSSVVDDSALQVNKGKGVT